MIVRILTEGQYDLPGAFIDDLNAIDNELVEIVAAEDAEGFARVLKQMLDLVREKGSPVPMDEPRRVRPCAAGAGHHAA